MLDVLFLLSSFSIFAIYLFIPLSICECSDWDLLSRMSFKELIDSKHPTAWIEFEKGLIDEVQCHCYDNFVSYVVTECLVC